MTLNSLSGWRVLESHLPMLSSAPLFASRRRTAACAAAASACPWRGAPAAEAAAAAARSSRTHTRAVGVPVKGMGPRYTASMRVLQRRRGPRRVKSR
jgi:hypothetical protein